MRQREIEFSFKRTFISPLLPFVIPLLSEKLAQITLQNIQKNQSQAHCFLYQLSHPNKEKKKEKKGRWRSLWVENKVNLTSRLIQYTEIEPQGFRFESQWEIYFILNCWHSRSWLTCFRLLTHRPCLSLLSESLPCYWQIAKENWWFPNVCHNRKKGSKDLTVN